MITQKDITKLEEKFATKDDLRKTEKSITEAITTFKDEILHEIKNLREDVTIVTGYKDQIEDHDLRIEKIEKHIGFKPAAV
jgi:hypothetical protein